MLQLGHKYFNRLTHDLPDHVNVIAYSILDKGRMVDRILCFFKQEDISYKVVPTKRTTNYNIGQAKVNLGLHYTAPCV